MKKLTITVSDEVYKGLYAKIGAGRISHFLDSLARAHVVDSAVTEGYRAMGKDENRERDALDWSEILLATSKICEICAFCGFRFEVLT